MSNPVIWKFPLIVQRHQKVELPMGSQPIHIDMQGGQPTLWAVVDPQLPTEHLDVVMFGTGHPIVETAPLMHLGTVMDGSLVWHYFLRAKPQAQPMPMPPELPSGPEA